MKQGSTRNLFVSARDCLLAEDPEQKVQLAERLRSDWDAGRLAAVAVNLPEVLLAGRPARPPLVHPRELPRRSLASEQGQLALIHALAHIEFNAINLACDAVFRFRRMPDAYYGDWLRVAAEEAVHFRLLRTELHIRGAEYGDFPAHDGLWDMARRTAGDPLLRMALVPRMLEARGLDVTPGMIEKFRTLRAQGMVDALTLILREEVGHVGLGSYWFDYLCRERGLDPEQTYFQVLEEELAGEIRCPLNLQARRDAGFSDGELQRLEAMCRQPSSKK